jgi:plastocyanin
VVPMTPRLPLLALGLAAVVAGCGSTASGSTTSGGAYSAPAATATASPAAHAQTIKLSADPSGALRFNTTHLTAKPGTIKLVLTNPSSSGMPHGIAIQGHGSGAVVNAGQTTSVTATLKKGTYTFLCPVPGHAAAGMKGTLTVK